MSNFDGDPKTDLAVWRPADGTWTTLTSESDWTAIGFTRQLGITGDIPIA